MSNPNKQEILSLLDKEDFLTITDINRLYAHFGKSNYPMIYLEREGSVIGVNLSDGELIKKYYCLPKNKDKIKEFCEQQNFRIVEKQLKENITISNDFKLKLARKLAIAFDLINWFEFQKKAIRLKLPRFRNFNKKKYFRRYYRAYYHRVLKHKPNFLEKKNKYQREYYRKNKNKWRK